VTRDWIGQRRRLLPLLVCMLLAPALGARQAPTSLHGLVVLIDFPDAEAQHSVEEIDARVNEVGFSNAEMDHSIRDYWFAQSRGAVDLTHDVVGFYRAPQTAAWYRTQPWETSVELMRDALDWVVQQYPAFDWDALSLASGDLNRNGTEEGTFLSIMFFTSDNVPGAGGTHWLTGWTAPNGVATQQVTAAWLEIPFYLFVPIHEMGHSIWGWPDTYDYTDQSWGTGRYTLMSGWTDGNTHPVGAPFLAEEGWVDIIDIGLHQTIVLEPDGDTVARYVNPADDREYLLIEARTQTTMGNETFPVPTGLVIWHVDERKTNNTERQRTPELHYRYSVEQADGQFDLENRVGEDQADAGDPYVPGDAFTDTTSPDSRWWDGSPSYLSIDQILILPDGRISFRARLAVPNMVQNGAFNGSVTGWTTYGAPTPSVLQHNSGAGGVFEFYRNPPGDGTPDQATVYQLTGLAVAAGVPLTAQFDLGNSSTVRKRISVLILEHDFSDLSVCTFWLDPASPMRTYRMRTHTTTHWTNAAIYFYAASTGEHGGRYRLDNVSFDYDPTGPMDRTDCEDPTAPDIVGITGPDLIVNGSFSAAFAPPWEIVSTLVWQTTGGRFQFYRPATAPNTPAGVVLQRTQVPIGENEILTATFDLGNSSTVRQRVTAILHDADFSDLSACTFWLAPGQPLATYRLRTFTTKAWAGATWSLYGATVAASGNGPAHQWIEYDNVSLRRTPNNPALGTECIEPAIGADVPSATMGITR
jgi:M6 family metalloprotease-like protein